MWFSRTAQRYRCKDSVITGKYSGGNALQIIDVFFISKKQLTAIVTIKDILPIFHDRTGYVVEVNQKLLSYWLSHDCHNRKIVTFFLHNWKCKSTHNRVNHSKKYYLQPYMFYRKREKFANFWTAIKNGYGQTEKSINKQLNLGGFLRRYWRHKDWLNNRRHKDWLNNRLLEASELLF